jgi:hypothetical protein
VTAIWRAAAGGWALLTAAGFPDEATLHRLVEETPALLPLSGSLPLLAEKCCWAAAMPTCWR